MLRARPKTSCAAMFLMRAEHFGVLRRQSAISTAWPITYQELEPSCTLAEGPLNFGTASAIPALMAGLFVRRSPSNQHVIPILTLANKRRMHTVENDGCELGFRTFPIPLGPNLKT